MLPRNHLDRIQVAFDDHRLVDNAGLLLPATLALHLGFCKLVQQRLGLGDAQGQANNGDKIMMLVASALAGGDCINDADALRAGGTVGVLDCMVKVPPPRALSCAALAGATSANWNGEPRVAGTGTAGRSRIRRRDLDHRSRFRHLRDLRIGQGRGATQWLHWKVGLTPTAGPGLKYWGRHRRDADVPSA